MSENFLAAPNGEQQSSIPQPAKPPVPRIRRSMFPIGPSEPAAHGSVASRLPPPSLPPKALPLPPMRAPMHSDSGVTLRRSNPPAEVEEPTAAVCIEKLRELDEAASVTGFYQGGEAKPGAPMSERDDESTALLDRSTLDRDESTLDRRSFDRDESTSLYDRSALSPSEREPDFEASTRLVRDEHVVSVAGARRSPLALSPGASPEAFAPRSDVSQESIALSSGDLLPIQSGDVIAVMQQQEAWDNRPGGEASMRFDFADSTSRPEIQFLAQSMEVDPSRPFEDSLRRPQLPLDLSQIDSSEVISAPPSPEPQRLAAPSLPKPTPPPGSVRPPVAPPIARQRRERKPSPSPLPRPALAAAAAPPPNNRLAGTQRKLAGPLRAKKESAAETSMEAPADAFAPAHAGYTVPLAMATEAAVGHNDLAPVHPQHDYASAPGFPEPAYPAGDSGSSVDYAMPAANVFAPGHVSAVAPAVEAYQEPASYDDGRHDDGGFHDSGASDYQANYAEPNAGYDAPAYDARPPAYEDRVATYAEPEPYGASAPPPEAVPRFTAEDSGEEAYFPQPRQSAAAEGGQDYMSYGSAAPNAFASNAAGPPSLPDYDEPPLSDLPDPRGYAPGPPSSGRGAADPYAPSPEWGAGFLNGKRADSSYREFTRNGPSGSSEASFVGGKFIDESITGSGASSTADPDSRAYQSMTGERQLVDTGARRAFEEAPPSGPLSDRPSDSFPASSQSGISQQFQSLPMLPTASELLARAKERDGKIPNATPGMPPPAPLPPPAPIPAEATPAPARSKVLWLAYSLVLGGVAMVAIVHFTMGNDPPAQTSAVTSSSAKTQPAAQPSATTPSVPPGYPPYQPVGQAYPPGAYPPGAYPPGAYPPGAYPPGAYPPGAYPPGAYPQGQQGYVYAAPTTVTPAPAEEPPKPKTTPKPSRPSGGARPSKPPTTDDRPPQTSDSKPAKDSNGRAKSDLLDDAL